MADRQKKCIFLTLGVIQLVVAIVYCIASVFLIINFVFPNFPSRPGVSVVILLVPMLCLVTAIMTCTSAILTRPVVMGTLTFNIIAASITPIFFSVLLLSATPIIKSELNMQEATSALPILMMIISLGIFCFLAIVTASYCCTTVGCRSEPKKGPKICMGTPNHMPYTGTVIITEQCT